jgi:hypothetical protein
MLGLAITPWRFDRGRREEGLQNVDDFRCRVGIASVDYRKDRAVQAGLLVNRDPSSTGPRKRIDVIPLADLGP